MKYFYYPKRLARAKEEIEKVHTKKEESAVVEDIQSLKTLIDEIVALGEYELEEYSCILNKKELQMLCMYIPCNKFRVPLENLLGVVYYQLSELRMEILYKYWQNNYFNKESFGIFDMIQKQQMLTVRLQLKLEVLQLLSKLPTSILLLQALQRLAPLEIQQLKPQELVQP